MKPLRILLLAPVNLQGIGGAERHINNFLRVLTSLGHQVTVQSEADARPLHGWRAAVAHKVGALKSVFFVSRLPVSTQGWDFVLSFDLSGFGVRNPRHIRVLAGCASAFRLKALAPQTGVLKRVVRAAVTQLYRLTELASSRGLGNVACSAGLARDVQALGLPVIATIDPPSDLRSLYATSTTRKDACDALGLNADHRYLAVVGRWEYAKGSDRLSALADELPQGVSFILAGPRPDQVPANVLARTAYCDSVPADRVHEVYRAAEAVLLPTRFEGSSMVLTEALACGTPVLTTAVGSGVDLQEFSAALGELVVQTPDNTRAWLAALERLTDPTTRADTLAQARVFTERYSLESVATRWQALFKEVLCKEFS